MLVFDLSRLCSNLMWRTLTAIFTG